MDLVPLLFFLFGWARPSSSPHCDIYITVTINPII